MPYSNATKQAFADALRKLLEQKPFAKISVSHICEECGMNRKSFYYHFKDKYDLVNWIFDDRNCKGNMDCSGGFEQIYKILHFHWSCGELYP